MIEQSKNLLSLKIAELIKLAQINNRDAAIRLLLEVEHQIVNKKTSDANKKLIDAIKNKYSLFEAIEEQSQSYIVSEKIGYGVDKPRAGVSVVNCCRNRTENILKALPTWLAHKEIREVIIIDWTSDNPVGDSLKQHGFKDNRIKVVRVENEPRWILSYAFNLGFRIAQHDRILKIDADITLKENFFENNKLLAGTFIAGDWTKAEKGQEHINGFFYVKNKDIQRIKGFNEYITTYGWDDDDIYSRLIASGLQRISVDTKTIYHIPHDDASRLDGVGKGNTNTWTELAGDPLYKIRTNRFLATVMPYWNSDRVFAPFKILKSDSNELIVERVLAEMPHYVSQTMRNNAEKYAATEIISWHVGPAAFHLEEESFDRLLSIKKINEISKFDVDLMLKGLGDKSKLSKHSVYLEFDIKNDKFDLGALKKLVLKLNSLVGVGIFISSYGRGSDIFFDQMKESVTRLKQWVTAAGLSAVNENNLHDLKVKIYGGSGCHIRVTDEILTVLRKSDVAELCKDKKDYLYIDTQHGLGNRLRAYGSAAAIAKATNRDLVVVWVPDIHCECRFTDLFDHDGPIIESYDDLPKDLHRYNYMEIEEDGEKGAEIILKEGRDVLVRSAFVLNHSASNWEVENKEIQLLKPNSLINSLVESVRLPDDSIGVHVRMEAGKGRDNNSYDSQQNWSKESHEQIHFWREKSHYSAFIKQIDILLSKNPNRSLFLATDLQENYEVFVNTYRKNLYYLKRSLYDRSKEQIQFALADAILLSKTSHLLGSNWSSFSEIAMRLSSDKQVIEMSGIDF